MFNLDFAYAYPPLALQAEFKAEPEDFIVVEELGFTPSGQGEHVFLWIEKRNVTTEMVAKDLAKSLGLGQRDIAYSGLKDKQAITQQWFALPWPIKKEFITPEGASWRVLQVARHDKKLRRGVHQANHFVITLKNIQGDTQQLEQRLQLIQQQGFPNYFGEQRFGWQGQNIDKALALFSGELRCKPFQRSIYYSAARSYLFNLYLSQRVQQGSWNQAIANDAFNLDGSNSVFFPETQDDLAERLAQQDIHPAGPLLGRKAFEQPLWQAILQENPALTDGLLTAGLESSFRPLRCMAQSLTWQIDGNQCELRFSLRTGSFATALIRELVVVEHEQT